MQKENLGSEAYADAVKTYTGSLDRWERYQSRETRGIATPKERTDEKKALAADIKEIDQYLDGKKNANLDKNPKNMKRVEKIEQAKKNIETRIQRIELAEKRQRQQEMEQRRKHLEEKKNNPQLGEKARQRLERNMSMASLAATKQLTQLGNQRTLSRVEQRNARTAMAALVLEDKLRQPGNEPLKKALAGGGKQYARAVKKIANSKEFREVFPSSTLTPANCKNLADNPKVAGRCAKEFNNRLVQKAQARRQRQQQVKRQKGITKNSD